MTLALQSANDHGRPRRVDGWRDALTVPNALTTARLLLGVCFPLFPESWRLPVVGIAMVTDMLDGAAGRRLAYVAGLAKCSIRSLTRCFLPASSARCFGRAR